MGDSATAAAPASIGNVAVGFDILGQAFGAAEDRVTAERTDEPGVRLGDVSGLVGSLPAEVPHNTALAAAFALIAACGRPFGVRLSIDKGIPLAAGMGGSAASAVAAVAAVNALLDDPLPASELLPFALEGERVASDPPHWDNAMASLLGGLVLAARTDPPLLRRLPLPEGIVTILFHPEAKVETRAARALLKRDVPLTLVVEHSRRLASFVAGCAAGDVALLRAGLEDLLIEPQRAHLLGPFTAVKRAALDAGALGCSFSGSGPSMFAWALAGDADAVEAGMAQAFAAAGTAARCYRTSGVSEGVRIL